MDELRPMAEEIGHFFLLAAGAIRKAGKAAGEFYCDRECTGRKMGWGPFSRTAWSLHCGDAMVRSETTIVAVAMMPARARA